MTEVKITLTIIASVPREAMEIADDPWQYTIAGLSIGDTEVEDCFVDEVADVQPTKG